MTIIFTSINVFKNLLFKNCSSNLFKELNTEILKYFIYTLLSIISKGEQKCNKERKTETINTVLAIRYLQYVGFNNQKIQIQIYQH